VTGVRKVKKIKR